MPLCLLKVDDQVIWQGWEDEAWESWDGDTEAGRLKHVEIGVRSQYGYELY